MPRSCCWSDDSGTHVVSAPDQFAVGTSQASRKYAGSAVIPQSGVVLRRLLRMKTTLPFLFMIVASSGHIAPVSGHDHGSGTATGGPVWSCERCWGAGATERASGGAASG